MKKRILLFFTAVAMLLCLAGCQKNNDAQIGESVSVTQAAVDEKASAIVETLAQDVEQQRTPKYEIIDWKMDDIVKNIVIDGKAISLPCAIEDLGDVFSTMSPSYSDANDVHQWNAGLYYNDTFVGSVTVMCDSDEVDLSTDLISFLTLFPSEYDCQIGKINFNMTEDELLSKLGEPNIDGASGFYKYYFSKNEIMSVMFLDDKMKSVTMIYCPYYEEASAASETPTQE